MFDLLTAVSVNGIIAPAPGGVSTALVAALATPPAVMERLYALRRLYDAVAVGPRTVAIDDPTLTSHRCQCFVEAERSDGSARLDDSARSHDPLASRAPAAGSGVGCTVRVTFDPAARIPRQARFFDGSVRTLVGVTAATPASYLEFLAARGVETVACGGGNRPDRIDLMRFGEELAARGLRRGVVEGGGRLNRELLRLGLVDRLHLLLLPAVLDARGPNLFDGPGAPWRLRLERSEALEAGYLLLDYRTEP